MTIKSRLAQSTLNHVCKHNIITYTNKAKLSWYKNYTGHTKSLPWL